jgi:hypothetical protein
MAKHCRQCATTRKIHSEMHSGKVEKILKGILDSIPTPSPSLKIQIMGGKVCLRCKGKTLLGLVNKRFVFKSRKYFKK